MSSGNPYSPPKTTDPSPDPQALLRAELVPATQGQRFLNCLIDFATVLMLFIATVVIISPFVRVGIFRGTGGTTELIFYGVVIVYYTLSEGISGRTLGKLVTGTKVINVAGGQPSFVVAFFRTLCRFIPFDFLSFLGADVRGWHDSITKTRVVKGPWFSAGESLPEQPERD